MVWVALISAIGGTVLLAGAGIRLPGLEFNNQKVEAAYRKELVFGEDHAERAQQAIDSRICHACGKTRVIGGEHGDFFAACFGFGEVAQGFQSVLPDNKW